MGSSRFWIGFGIVAGFVVLAIGAPLWVRADPLQIRLSERLCAPSWDHWMGCDELGRDVWSRWVYGARVSLTVAVGVTLIAGVGGGLLGLASGYVGGGLDLALMRLVDLMLAMPGLLITLALVAFLGPGLGNLIVALSLTGWAPYARLVRGAVLQFRKAEFVLASQAAGASGVWITVRHLLPQIAELWAVQANLSMAGLVIAEAGLSFLGLGVPPPTPSWGQMVATGIGHLLEAPHLSVFPGIGITLLVLGFTLMGERVE